MDGEGASHGRAPLLAMREAIQSGSGEPIPQEDRTEEVLEVLVPQVELTKKQAFDYLLCLIAAIGLAYYAGVPWKKVTRWPR